MPQVFISYSHDSEEHKAWVLTLARALQGHGADVLLDQLVPNRRPDDWDGWTIWCTQQLNRADFIVMVCSASYKERIMREDTAPKGSGACYEGRHILNAINNREKLSRFVPVLPSNSTPSNIPVLQDHDYFLPTTFANDDPEFRKLLKRLGVEELAPVIPRKVIISPSERKKPSDAEWSDETQREIHGQLKALQSMIQECEEPSGEIQVIVDLLNKWIGSGDDSAADYRKAVVKIARIVIDLRKVSSALTQKLIVPPYDLLLPFKASVRDAESGLTPKT